MISHRAQSRIRVNSIWTSQLAWLAAACVTLCSCQAIPQGNSVRFAEEPKSKYYEVSDKIARAAENTKPIPVECVPYAGLPIPVGCASPWAPPGMAGPWPRDEHLEDGGDQEVQVNIGSQGEIRGLELEDTVAIYDTRDGQTLIEPSNKVCLYSPRFAAVRKVTNVLQNLQSDQLVAAAKPQRANEHFEDRLATTAVQPVQPVGGIATKQPSIERVQEAALPSISRLPVAAIDGGFATYENLRVMRHGVFEESEKARLIEAVDAAIVWSHDLAVQVVLDGRQAVSVTGDQRAQATFAVDEPDHPCLRVIKVASTKAARPGDVVDFTIRFDNLGDQAIKRVVLIDNLTTRLEYVPGTAQSSRAAEFSTDANEGDSLVLRWEFSDPLPVGGGGLVRFHCRVR